MIISKLKPIKLFNFVLKTVFYILICLTFLSCEEQPMEEPPMLEFDEKTFYREWAAWEALDITDYSVNVQCEQHSPRITYLSYHAIVKDSKIIKLESFGEDYGTFSTHTISGRYVWISYLIDKNVRGSIRITYNTDFHYPEVITIELPRKNYSPNQLGSGVVYLSEFLPLTPETEE